MCNVCKSVAGTTDEELHRTTFCSQRKISEKTQERWRAVLPIARKPREITQEKDQMAAGQCPVQVRHSPSRALGPAGPRTAHMDLEGLGAGTPTATTRYMPVSSL